MALDGVAHSDAAIALSRSVSSALFAQANGCKRGKPSSAHERAVAALLCDLLRNAEDDPIRWGFRSHRAIEFTAQPVGYRVYTAVLRGLVDQQALEFVPGHQQYGHFGGSRFQTWRMSPRVRATASGLRLLATHDLTPANWRDHFNIVPTQATLSRKPPLECRSPSSRMGATRSKGSSLPIDHTDPEVVMLQNQVTRINAFLANYDIAGENHSAFQRIFHADHGGGCRWDKGGRLYSVDHENYQRAKKVSRAKMTIDGQAVVELDLTASHLTILHALRERDFDPSNDPYVVEGIPRSVVKKWVTMTLGHNKLHEAWPKGARNDLDHSVEGTLAGAYPIRKTRKAIPER